MKPATQRIGLLALSIGIAGYALLTFLPSFIDTTAIKTQIEEGLHESTGVHFQIKTLTLKPTLLQGIQAHLNTTAITDIQHHPLGQIENITVHIRYLPLFIRQTPEIAKIHLNHVVIPVGQHSLFKSLKLKLVKPRKTGFLNPAELKDAELLLTDYLVEDRKPASGSRADFPGIQRFRIEGKLLSLRHLESRRPLSLKVQGQLAYVARQPSQSGDTRYLIAPYKLLVELPQSVTQPGHVFQVSDFRRLEMTLGGQRIPIAFTYRHKPQQLSDARLKSAGFNLAQGQALASQLANTFGPLPALPYRLTGIASADAHFKVSVDQGQLSLKAAQGKLNLQQVALYRPINSNIPLLNNFHGDIRFKDQQILLHNGELLTQGLPFRLSGGYRLDNQQMEAVLFGRNLNMDALTDKAVHWGVPTSVLKGRAVRGLLDLSVYLSGTLSKPQYKGLFVLRDGEFSDTSLGIQAQKMRGRLAFHGQGFTAPVVAYTGQLAVPQGSLKSTQQGLTVEQFQGRVDFNGQARPLSGKLALPDLRGLLAFQKGRYQDPEHPVPVTDLQGTLHLLGQWIQLDELRGTLGGGVFKAKGRLATNLKDYQLQLTGNDIDIPRFTREVLVNLPELQPFAHALKPYSGLANLNMTIQTGLRLAGSLDIKSLALQTIDPHSPIQAPQLALRFNGNNLTLADTTILYGPLAARIGGTADTQGAYNVRLNTDPIPVAFVRDQQMWLEALSGLDFPEVWNTAGDFNLSGTLSNREKLLIAQFNQAGLSWAGADFPLYNLNGSLRYQQRGEAAPVLQSQDLTFKYGNSPMSVAIQHDQGLHAELKGRLSDLLVNHLLVSPQSNATPYQAMPFKMTVDGKLVALPGQPGAVNNDLDSTVFVGLSQNFREAYSSVTSPSQIPAPGAMKPETSKAEASKEEASQPDFSVAETAPDIVGEAAKRDALRNINTINAANTALGAASNAVGKVRQTVGKGLDVGLNTLKKPGQFITQKLLEKPHESVQTQALRPEQLPESMRLKKPPLESMMEDNGRAFLYGQFRLLGNELRLRQANLHLFDGGDILAEGSLEHLDQPEQSPYRLHLVTVPEINLAGISQGARQNSFFQGAKGTLGADLTLSGGGDTPRTLNGWLGANRLEIPYLTLQDITARLEFAGETAQIDVPSFKVPGVTARLSARSDSVFEVPIPLEAVKVNGSFVSIESLSEFNNTIVKPILIDQVAHNYLRPWQQGDPTSAVQFRDGDLQVDEVIYQNVILSNLRSKLSLNGNSFLEMTDARLDAAGGQVSGYLSLSPNENSFTTLDLNANGVKANALTKALLNVTNQIFGDLSGTVRFTTFGQSDVEMQRNANGTVGLKVTDGRLPAIAKVETLLATANVFRGGVLGLNLNNLFRSLTFYDTNYFAELSGDMLINNQILYTQNLISDGVNLDLLIQGSLRMDNGNANMLINGRMSQNIAGKLGAFGNLSLGRLLSYVPALGNLGEHRPGLLGYIPGVGYVPGFGGPAKQFNRFQVRLVGQPDDPDAIRDFRWIRSQNL